MKQKKCIASILLLGTVCVQANNYEVTSPDGRLAVKVECVDGKRCMINKKRVCHKSMAHPLLCYLLYNPRSIVAYSKKGII